MNGSPPDALALGGRASAPSGLGAQPGWLVLVLLLPFWFDTLAFVAFLATRSRDLYSMILLAFEIVAAGGALFYFKPAWQVLRSAYGVRFLIPAGLYGLALAGVVLNGSGNQEFVLAALRYLPWLILCAGCIARHSTGRTLRFPAILVPLGIGLAVLALLQMSASYWLAGPLAEVHRGLMAEGRLNAVLTSIGLEKVFASLTLRNPIELGYVGLFLFCLGCARAAPRSLLWIGLALVVAGRSNTTLMAAMSVLTVQAVMDSGMSAARRVLLAVLGAILFVALVWALPRIYLGAGSDWDHLIETLGMQRLGIILALPAVIDDAGLRILVNGLPVALEPLVEDLFAAGLLPELFADGGAIAVFDIMWFGMLLVGGLPFVLGGAALLSLRTRVGGPVRRAAQLYALAALLVSFSSQVLLSRYGLFFLCVLLAAAAVERNAQALD
jgi:hypothetical protein